ncbi:hypothetical protein ACFQZE_21290 [Paenibacillus sp. GCM10027627]|uniref:hypothetical protein n=1 Tax=unclassified Paenibacillus TaxID=185978 RepID=UPI003635C8B6
MKQAQRFVLITSIMLLLVMIIGCSFQSEPKKALLAATLKTMDAKSYKMLMTIGLDKWDLPPNTEVKSQGLSTALIAGILKDATIKADVLYSKEPSLRTDIKMDVTLPSLLDTKLSVPMIMTDKKLYIQLPSIPLVGLPESAVGKYIVVDLEEQAKQEGREAASFNAAEQLKLVQELSGAALKHFDEKTYFKEVKAADASLPEGLKTDQIVHFSINEGNYSGTVETVVNKVLPEMLELVLSNDAYLTALQIKKADAEKWKSELETDKTGVLNILQNDVKVHAFDLTGAIKGGYLVYQAGKFDVDVNDKQSGLTTGMGFTFASEYVDFGKEIKFEQDIPADALTPEQFKELIGAATKL